MCGIVFFLYGLTQNIVVSLIHSSCHNMALRTFNKRWASQLCLLEVLEM